MNVIIGCECSGTVRDAFIKKGHKAVSCDLKPSTTGGPHIKADLLTVLCGGTSWDLGIFFPPCTHLSVSGAKHFHYKRESGVQQKAIDFFLTLANFPIPKSGIENPVGIMSTIYRKPDQIIQPYYFGDPYQKTTCLWLKNLPKLFHAKQTDLFNDEITHVPPGPVDTFSSGKRMASWLNLAKKNNYSDLRSSIRSKTFPGLAAAMAAHWG